MRNSFLALGVLVLLAAGVNLAQSKSENGGAKGSGTGSADKGNAAPQLAGRWLMTLPAGFKRQIVIRTTEGDRFVLEEAARFSGTYEFRDGRLITAKAEAVKEHYEWKVGADELTLVAQPPKEKLGQNYLGATLKRLRDGEAGDASALEKDKSDTTAKVPPKPAPAGSSPPRPDSKGEPANAISAEEARWAQRLKEIRAEYRVRKEPPYEARVQYCLLLLGREAKTRLWLASDGKTLFIDKNGNGDLTEPGEAVPFAKGFAAFMTDSFPGHKGDAPHTSLHIAVRQRDWEKNEGGYWALRADVGDTYHMYGFVHKFAQKPDDAPALHLGGPLRMGLYQLEGGSLVRGRPAELNAYAACQYPGVEKSFVDVDRRCPKGVHPIAEIRPLSSGADAETLRVPLTKRC